MIGDSDRDQGVIEQASKARLTLPVEQAGYELLGSESRHGGRELQFQHLALRGRHRLPTGDPVASVSQRWFDAFHLIGELVAQKFVEERLDDDLVFVAVIAEAIAGAYGLQPVDQVAGLLLVAGLIHWDSVKSASGPGIR